MAERAAGHRRTTRRWIVPALLAGGAVLLFTAFLIANFPYNDMASTILSPYQLKLDYRAQHMRLPLGVRLEGVDLVSVASSPGQLILRSRNIALQPTLGALFLGRPGLGLDAELYRGTLHGTLEQEAGAIGVTFDARALSLGESQILNQFGAQLGGTLSAGGSARISGPNVADGTGRATIDGHDVTVEITNGFPLIHLGTVTGRLTLERAVLNFQDLETHGGDVESKADGAIQLAADPADSTIKARVYLTPTPSGRAHFGLLFNMLPHPPSEGPYEVSGPLLSPAIN